MVLPLSESEHTRGSVHESLNYRLNRVHGFPGRMPAQGHFCSREESRQARKIIAETVYPFLDKDPARVLPTDCPLHPAFDVFRDQESHKSLVPGKTDLFQCHYCQKQFRTEFYMDRHMDNKHADKLNMGDDDSSPRCLDSLCGVLGCGEFSTDGCAIGGRGEGAGGSVGGGMMGCGACDNADMDKRRFRCKALFHRCFDPSKSVAYGSAGGGKDEELTHLRDLFVRQFCNHLGCDAHNRPLPSPPRPMHPLSHRSGSSSGMGVAKMVLIGVVILGLIVLYAGMAMGSWSRSTRKDLRPRRSREGAAKRLSGGIGGGGLSSTGTGRGGIGDGSGQLRRRVRVPG